MQYPFHVTLLAICLSLWIVPAVAAPAMHHPFYSKEQLLDPASLAVFNSGGDKKHREFKHHSYEVIDTAFFIIYHGYKNIEKIPNKGIMTVGQYYFSKTASGDIYELSIENLKKVFPENTRFHYALEAAFRSDKNLMAYDSYLKEYKIKYLFSESVK